SGRRRGRSRGAGGARPASAGRHRDAVDHDDAGQLVEPVHEVENLEVTAADGHPDADWNGGGTPGRRAGCRGGGCGRLPLTSWRRGCDRQEIDTRRRGGIVGVEDELRQIRLVWDGDAEGLELALLQRLARLRCLQALDLV